VAHSRWSFAIALGVFTACGSSSHDVNFGSLAGRDAALGDDVFGAEFLGDGLQCGAIVCSSGQQCCLVYIPPDATSSNPTHACDQNCESVCADVCPDAGGQTGTGMPGMGAMAPMGGMGGMGGPMGGMNMAGMDRPEAGPKPGAPPGPGMQPEDAGDE
jgi:hypothetical protein